MKSLTALLICALPFVVATGPARAFDLRVEVSNVRAAQGRVLGAVYADATGWLTPASAVRVAMAPAADKTVLVYRDLPAGRYAVSLFQDENDNGRLDANPAGIPLERYGFSRDARGRMGPPAFADAALDLSADSTVTIDLR